MTAQPTAALMTADQLIAMPRDGARQELVEGVLHEMPPPGFEHGQVSIRVASLLSAFVRPRGLGVVTGETGFRLAADPDTVRAPDAAFVAADRLPPRDQRRGYLRLAPDLAVEVLSPDDRPRAVAAKTRAWLAAGVRILWVIDPVARRVTVHAPGQPAVEAGPGDALDGGEALPGFVLPVGDLFD